ncbi:tetratricopeptide repeat protein [Tenacibaculum insulae]|uniref:tetratricopeptide repeat protein n=1 Tax=Tenacibaculum insulae TaxID=2029677 RepID=UPI003AB26D8F
MIKKQYNILLFFLFSCSLAFAQKNEQKIDSITSLLNITTSDSLLVNYHIELGVLKDKINPIAAEKHLKTALGKLNKNYNYSDKLKMMALANDCLGIIERRRNNYDVAYSYYLEALKIKEIDNDSIKIGRSFHNIAMLFSAKRNYNKAIEYIKKALPIRKKYDSLDYAKSLNNYGYFLYKKRKYALALTILDSAKIYYAENFKKADANNNIARIFNKQKKYNLSIKIQLENIRIYKKNEKIERLANTYKDIAVNFRKLNKHTKAYMYLDSSETICKIYNNKKLLSILYKQRYKIANSKNEFEKALNNYKTYRKYKDTAFNNKQSEKIKELELDYFYKKKALTDSLKAENDKIKLLSQNKHERSQKKWYAFLFIVTSLGLIALFLIYRNHRRIAYEKNRKQEIKNDLLNEQINFLRYKTERLFNDNKMRSNFNSELSDRIKALHKSDNSSVLLKEYQSIIIQLKQQKQTEKKLNYISENTTIKDDLIEKKLIEQFPSLTKSEREVCKLIYLDMNSKEIMNTRDLTISSIKSIRFRIRKKLKINKGEELGLFIKNLLNKA